MRIALIACLLIVSALANNREEEYNQIIALAQTGATPGQIVADRLDAHILSIRNEQLGHDDLKVEQQAICEEELQFRNKQVSSAIDALQRAGERRNKCNTAYTQVSSQLAKSDIATFNKYKTIFEEDLAFIKKYRDDERTAFNRKMQNFNFALETIEQCEPIIAQWEQNQGSFAQLTQHVNKMFVQAAKSGYTSELAPVIAILAEIQTEQPGALSSDLAARLRNVLTTIRDKILAAMSTLTEGENQAIVEFNDRRERLVHLLQLINDLLIHLQEYSEDQQKCITLETDIINAATAKRSRNQYMLNYTQEMCSAFAAEYVVQYSQRSQQIDTLQKLRKFVLSKQDEFGSFSGEEVNEVFSGRRSHQEPAFVQLSANIRSQNN